MRDPNQVRNRNRNRDRVRRRLSTESPLVAAREVDVRVRLRRRADVGERAVRAVRVDRGTRRAPVIDHQVSELLPVRFRNDIEEVLLDPFRAVLIGAGRQEIRRWRGVSRARLP